ncbi:MAG: transglycosylase SLT domain-containing protein [Vulcanimicrobiota bacterium]
MRNFFLACCLLLTTMTALAGPVPFEESQVETALYQSPRDLYTEWGYGPRENWYNGMILNAVSERWVDHDRPLSPMVFKALVAVESSFRPNAISPTGAAGLVQLTPDTATRFKLPLAQRLDPSASLPVGVAVLQEKHRVILEPGNYYGILLNRPEKRCPYGDKVQQAFDRIGLPEGESLAHLELAAFNGGGGTIMRAMARAYDMGLDPRDWNQLVGTSAANSPLYYACRLIYKGGAANKYREVAEYPEKILGLHSR